MCGIIAIVGPQAEEKVRQVLPLIEHRGLRTQVMSKGHACVAHARLPIVGLGEENDQPFSTGDDMFAFVGEVLDFRERTLSARSYDCDSRYAYDLWRLDGPEFLNCHDGFWHAVAYEHRTKKLHMVVDYLAQKPLYYRCDSVLTAASSELDPLVEMAPTTLDKIYLSAVAKWGYCPEGSRTPYCEIAKMAPGEFRTIQAGGSSSNAFVDNLESISGSPDEIRRLIEEAIARRVLSADVPVACLVSGGLDSSIVYTLARRYGDVRAYHVENGELEACMSVAPEATVLQGVSVPLGKALGYMQEPIDLGSLIPQVALSDAIADSGGERVCLTGDGADEFFGGYGRSMRYDSQASDVFHELVNWHLPRLDRVMMRNRIEVRSPFLSRQVAEAALGLPRSLRTGKTILKNLFAGVVPDDVIRARKRPLRTKAVEDDRESVSRQLVNAFTINHTVRQKELGYA